MDPYDDMPNIDEYFGNLEQYDIDFEQWREDNEIDMDDFVRHFE